MKFLETTLPGLYLIEPSLFKDERGWFFRTYCENEFLQIGFRKKWVQMNHSCTRIKGTIRGLHFQTPPHAEAKLVRCTKGAIFDVAVDIRSGSSTFLEYYGAELSAENKKMLFIPEGFAHGFQTLSDDCEVVYNHSAVYSKEYELAIRYSEPAINIKWPLSLTFISDRDKNHPFLTADFNGVKL